jgi:hypothetical protein
MRSSSVLEFSCKGLRVIVRDGALMSLKRPLPVTSYTECGNAGYNPTLTNLRCGKTLNSERCTGTNSSAINDSDWKECPSQVPSAV